MPAEPAVTLFAVPELRPVSSQRSCPIPHELCVPTVDALARKLAEEVCAPAIQHTILEFLTALQAVPEVGGVGFAVRTGQHISVYIFGVFYRRRRVAGDAEARVSELFGAFDDSIDGHDGLITCDLSLIEAQHSNVLLTAQRLQKEWNTDPSISLCALLAHERT